MSTLGPYSLRVTTSGAIQYGVPTIVVRFACAGSEICAQKPKSASFRQLYQTKINQVKSGERTEFDVACEAQ